MKVVVLGGSGEMGAAVCRALVRSTARVRVCVADRDLSGAERVARSISPEATATRIDVTDARATAALASTGDVVVNAVGPYFRHGPATLAAVLAAGRPYVDLCDDPVPTSAMLALDATARAEGVAALVGMGASPGLSNLLAMSAAAELEEVDEIVTGWNVDAARGETGPRGPSAAVVHGIEQISGAVPVWRGGRLVSEPALRRVEVDYPGIGVVNGRVFGHPEPLTLGRAVPGLRRSVNVAVGRRTTMAALRLLRLLADRSPMSHRQVADVAAVLERWEPGTPVGSVARAPVPPLFAVARGRREGQDASVACALGQLPGLTMAELTGVPAAVTVPLVVEANRPGVHTPETLLEPAAVWERLAPQCLGAPAPGAMVVTTRSWSSPSANSEALASSLVTAMAASNRAAPASV